MLRNLISTDLIFTNVVLNKNTKEQAIKKLAEFTAKVTNIDKGKLEDNILEREAIATTGIGKGVAIPHGRINGIDEIKVVIMKLKDGVEWDSLDDEKVNVIIAIIMPYDYKGNLYLLLLKEFAKKLVHDEFVKEIINEDDPKAIYNFLLNELKIV